MNELLKITDASVNAGIRGEWDNGMSFDFSARWGESEIKYTIFNTLNASLGPATPTAFRPGDLISDEAAVNADFAIPLDVGFASDLNVAFGFEYREEGYEVVLGEPVSYEIGPYAFEDPWNLEIDADEAEPLGLVKRGSNVDLTRVHAHQPAPLGLG